MQEPELWKSLLKEEAYEKLFGHLVEEYTERLYWHIRSILARHDWSDDVLQESFIKAWKALPKFRGEAAFYTWLYRIATNEAIGHLKKERRFQLHDQPLDLKLNADPYFDGDEATAILLEAIQHLPEKQQIVFKLKYFQEMPFKEMSTLLDTSIGALKASYHHAKEKIKTALNLQDLNES